ncbi:alginate lyase family protein [Mucilaginibacter terrigena]|uniref:Alginate lyase family protein n=1 Tax=Mucilaginibacter terrigena TaxID=2492395 RepID=A0A4Q5LKS7_9SPHI|nr:alginate lyase family protein [Mucilaginibacter terrigena]RYU90216.1 alginate lyase family protein [Mucilaginibacter terrigena]
MLDKIVKAGQLIGNMGWRYVFFRAGFELKKRSGLLQKAFLTNPAVKTNLTLAQWRGRDIPFFFKNKASVELDQPLSEELTKQYQKLSTHTYPFFSSLEFNLGVDHNWFKNPDTGFCYDGNAHWLNINDYSKTAGDIKFVWEPSRFSHLYTLIRYDKHSGKDCSKQVFSEIENWIDANKINQGPNYKCSQEISLRILNWTFALYYYRDSASLTDALFEKIQHYLYWQAQHVYDNINFSRIAVRNNHAITETLTLYLMGMLYPELPGAAKWKKDGKHWFEEEIAYQVYEDGTFLQFSMNYHRVVVQLLTWGIRLAEINNERFAGVVYDRAKKSLLFLTSCMDTQTGMLPNYGANDGALFFKLSDNHYRDYRPQLQALSNALGVKWNYGDFEDSNWYGLNEKNKKDGLKLTEGYSHFDKGGYHIYRKNNALSFIRCGDHKDRPSQADNLHLDIWHKGLNLLHDAGSYKYNGAPEDLKYFMGTQSHNTVMLGDNDQMEKGARFIWYHWTQCQSIKTEETDQYFYFEGTIKAFMHIDKSIRHTRRVKIDKTAPVWEVEDVITNKPADLALNQLWHTCFPEMLSIRSSTETDNDIQPVISDGYYSSFYGQKEKCTELRFSTNQSRIKTIITIN